MSAVNTSNIKAQWTQTNGPTGGSITCFAASGQNIYVGTSSAGVFISTNNGESWKAVNKGLPRSPVSSLETSGNKLFAGTEGKGIFLSTNNGKTWNAVNTGLPIYPLYSLVASGNKIFAGTGQGIKISTDYGESWSVISDIFDPNLSIAISGSNVFSGSEFGVIYRSTNFGENWSEIANISDKVNVLKTSGSNIFAGTDNGVHRSTDNGLSWNRMSIVFETQDIAVSGCNIFASCYGHGIYFSNDNGINWTAVNNGLDIKALLINGSIIFAGTKSSDGIFRSTDNGVNWTSVSIGLTNRSVSNLFVSGNNIFTGYKGIFITDNTGEIWNEVFSRIHVCSIAKSGSNLFAGTENGIYRSTNNGINWLKLNNGPPTNNCAVKSIVVNGISIFAGIDCTGLFKSTDEGDSWSAVNTGYSGSIQTLFINEGRIFAGTSFGIYLTTNNGENWTAINNGLNLSKKEVRSFAVSGSKTFAGTTYGGVYLSTNNGDSWAAVNDGLKGTTIYSFAVNDKYIYAGSDSGVFRSKINEIKWSSDNSGFSLVPSILSFTVYENFIYCGTAGQSVWKRSLTGGGHHN